MLTAADMSAKWAERAGSASAVEAYKKGINRVTESPAAKAAQKIDKYVAGVMAAIESGKTRDNMANSPLELYKRNALEIGASRISSGVKKGSQKYQNFANAYVPFLEGAVAANASMPDTNLEDRIAKSADMQRRLSQFKKPGGNSYR